MEEDLNIYEKLTILEKLTGHSLDVLIEKIAAGWTLEPPKESCTLSELYTDTKPSKKKITNRFRTL